MQQLQRVAIYARVSSEQQTGESTIASQLAALQARVSSDGQILPAEQCFVDDGYSGATLVRPALERLRDLTAAGGLDRVYVHSPDRLARRYAYQVLLVDELQRAGVEIVFLNRPIGTSAEDELLLQVQGMVAEYERAKILERSRRGKRHAAHAGSVNVLSGAPYGYRYIGKHKGGGIARYEILEGSGHAPNARVVRQMFGWIGHDRLSLGEVCRRLRQQGCATRSGKLAWDRTTVWGILRNPAYRGQACFGKTRVGPRSARPRPVRGGSEQPRRAHRLVAAPAAEWIHVPVPAVVDPALFDAVQEQLAENRRRSRQSARGARYLLQGLVVCRSCGYAYYGKPVSLCAAKGKRRDYAYYRCCGSDAYRFGGQRVCTNPQLRTDRLDAAVWQEVERLLRDPRRIAAEYERRLAEARRRDAGGADLAAAELQLAKLRRGMDRLIDSYAEGLIERREFEPRIAGFRQRIRGWEAQAGAMRDEAAQRRTLSLIIGRLEDFADRVHDRVAEADWRQRRELIRMLVKRVEIDREDVNIVFRVEPLRSPPDPNGSGIGSILQDCRRREHRALGRPLLGRDTLPVLQHARLEPFLDQADDPSVADPVLQEADQPLVADPVEERPDVGVEDPADVASLDPVRERVQRVVLAAPGPEPVAEAQELRLVDRRQDHDHRGLDDLVLQGRDAERPLPAVRLRDVHPPRRQRPIRPCVKPPMQGGEVVLAARLVCLPRHRVGPGSRAPLEREERGPEHADADVVQERRQSLRAVPVDGLPYADLRL
jgi:site-specific DNA recombinase